MFGLRRKTARSKKVEASEESAEPLHDDVGSEEPAIEPEAVNAAGQSNQETSASDDELFLVEADEVVEPSADNEATLESESKQEMSEMQSEEVDAAEEEPIVMDNVVDEKASVGGANGGSASAITADKAILHIGPGTVLKGDITTCESLIVQGNLNGTVEASLMLLAHGGVVDGTVNVQAAEIEGTFTGTLTVKGLLCVKGGGQIQGTVRYGELEIERGCQLNGDISQHEASTAKPASTVSRVRGTNPAGVKAA